VITAAIEASMYFDSYQDLDGGGFILFTKESSNMKLAYEEKRAGRNSQYSRPLRTSLVQYSKST
jgi:hypothetical protein